jgi:hypothetical protein
MGWTGKGLLAHRPFLDPFTLPDRHLIVGVHLAVKWLASRICRSIEMPRRRDVILRRRSLARLRASESIPTLISPSRLRKPNP